MASISNLNKSSGDYVHFDTELYHVIQNKGWAQAVSLIHTDRKLIEQLLPKQFSSLLHALRQEECSPEGTIVYQDMLHAPQMHDLDRYTLKIQSLDQVPGDPEQTKRLEMFLQSPFAKQFSVPEVQKEYRNFQQGGTVFLKLDDLLPSQEAEKLKKEIEDALKELHLTKERLQKCNVHSD